MSPAADRVLAVLKLSRGHVTVDGLTALSGVSRSVVRTLLEALDAEGRLDIRRESWPHSYKLKAAGRG